MSWLSSSSPHMKAKLRLLAGFLVVLGLTAFDVRDIVYKTSWLGPYDSFKFSATGDNVLEAQELTLAIDLTTSGQEKDRPNGWSSFFEKCTKITPSGDVFRVALAENCTIGSISSPRTIPKLVLASSMRVDSIAWASCRLLLLKRQPSLCSAQLVRGFEARYYMESPNVPTSWIAKPNSDEEDELLELLNVIATSFSVDRITCLEGFEYAGSGRYNSTIVGCGSPNYFSSAFAGYHATKLRELLYDKAYLTMHDINLMGFHYGIRENCISDFLATYTDSGRINVIYTTIINFSTYGQLYALQIVNDVLLMVVNLLTVLQIGLVLVIPAFRLKTPHGIDNFLREGHSSFLECTLYRSPVIIAMVVISQLLSWLLVLPNSVIWTWGNSTSGKIQAYLSSVRLWTLILLVVNMVWDFFTFLNEKLAYQIAKFTFLTPAEIIAIGALVSYWNRQKVFAIEQQIDELQFQRQMDATSFRQFKGASNAYNPEMEHKLNTSTQVLWVLYKPLFTILLISVIAVFAYAGTKFCFYYWTPFGQNRHRNYLVTVDVAQENQSEGSVLETKEEPNAPQRPLPVEQSTRSLGTFIHFAHADRSFVAEQPGEEDSNPGSNSREYSRLPLENLVNKPIRARSLIRPSLELDHIVNHERFVSARLYLEFGIFFVKGRMKPRWGFLNPIPPLLQVDNSVISDMIQPLTPEELLKRLRSAAKKK